MHIDQIMFGTCNTSKPTVIFVTGAWHQPHLYAPLLDGLKKTSYPVVAPSLPSVGGSSGDDFAHDVRVIRKAIAEEVAQGHEIIVLMHSYGGMVGSAAVQGYAKGEVRSEGGVIRMIYLTAFAMDVGLSLMDGLNGTPLPWFASANANQWAATNTSQIFYNDVDPSIADPLADELDLQSKASFEAKQTYAAWKYIDSTYIVCELDNAIPKQAQVAMASQPGGKFTIEYLKAGHSPFLSMPQSTVETIRKILWEPV